MWPLASRNKRAQEGIRGICVPKDTVSLSVSRERDADVWNQGPWALEILGKMGGFPQRSDEEGVNGVGQAVWCCPRSPPVFLNIITLFLRTTIQREEGKPSPWI